LTLRIDTAFYNCAAGNSDVEFGVSQAVSSHRSATVRECPMDLRATKGDEDARCGRTLWSFLVVCGRRA